MAAAEERGDRWRPPVTVGGQELAWVSRFKYLGSMFHQGGSLAFDLARRIQLAAVAFRRLEKPFFRQRCIPIRMRMLVYTAMVTSVLLYGGEAWALSAAQLHHLEVFHRQRLRKILGIRLSDRIASREVYERCGSTTVEVMLARRQLRWLGHLGRMQDDRIAKQVLYSTMAAPGRSRRRGRPPPAVCAAYKRLVQLHLTRSQMRECGLPRGSTWHTVCQDRALYRNLCP